MILTVLLIVLSLFVDGWPWQFTALGILGLIEVLFEIVVVDAA